MSLSPHECLRRRRARFAGQCPTPLTLRLFLSS